MANSENSKDLPGDVSQTLALLTGGDYIAGRDLATVVYLALRMGRPLLLEGEAGVGKTEIAKVLVQVVGVMIAETVDGIRAAVTGAGACAFRASEIEATLADDFTAARMPNFRIRRRAMPSSV